jgi:hypothetical protein
MTNRDNDKTDGSTDPERAEGTHWRQVTQRHYDPDRESELTTAIVFAIADAEGVDPSEVESPKLYEIVDVAAIDEAFFSPETGTSHEGMGTVEFRYTEYRIIVRSDGWIQVYEPTETDLS